MNLIISQLKWIAISQNYSLHLSKQEPASSQFCEELWSKIHEEGHNNGGHISLALLLRLEAPGLVKHIVHILVCYFHLFRQRSCTKYLTYWYWILFLFIPFSFSPHRWSYQYKYWNLMLVCDLVKMCIPLFEYIVSILQWYYPRHHSI